jgi:hypothetical protein
MDRAGGNGDSRMWPPPVLQPVDEAERCGVNAVEAPVA